MKRHNCGGFVAQLLAKTGEIFLTGVEFAIISGFSLTIPRLNVIQIMIDRLGVVLGRSGCVNTQTKRIACYMQIRVH